MFAFPFDHKCKAYPNGIPKEIMEQDTLHVDCQNEKYHFEPK